MTPCRASGRNALGIAADHAAPHTECDAACGAVLAFPARRRTRVSGMSPSSRWSIRSPPATSFFVAVLGGHLVGPARGRGPADDRDARRVVDRQPGIRNAPNEYPIGMLPGF